MRHLLLAFCLALPLSATAAENPQVIFETTKGKIVVKLDAEKAPISTKNMLDYVDAKFYDGTIFHRVIPGFMVQGGGFTKDLSEKSTKAPIKNEAGNGLSNKRGTLAMARTGVVDSATAQFFINVVDNNRLDHKSNNPNEFGYAVFGEVVEGMDVVDAIVNTPRICPSDRPGPCDAQLPPGMRDVPKDAVIITKAYRKK
jgi:peptidyl-prolyl cis-trans isomerase A (cyclophilin A)